MKEEFIRSALVLGEENIHRLSNCRVAVFGLGGVGGYAVECLARIGIGTLDLFDGDVISLSNINRQILAVQGSVGMKKTQVASQRIKSINPDICANEYPFFFNQETKVQVDFSLFDYVIDAIDDVGAKVLLAVCCKQSGTPLISCMGTGNKLNPMGFKVADIYKTKVCPLARVMRRELKAKGIEHLKVVYSEEEPATAVLNEGGRHIPGSVSFVPPAAGLLLAAETVKDLIKKVQ
ncbi:MAG: ThiF family adenylyltransferase [Candidatus Coproplasma sp.]